MRWPGACALATAASRAPWVSTGRSLACSGDVVQLPQRADWRAGCRAVAQRPTVIAAGQKVRADGPGPGRHPPGTAGAGQPGREPGQIQGRRGGRFCPNELRQRTDPRRPSRPKAARWCSRHRGEARRCQTRHRTKKASLGRADSPHGQQGQASCSAAPSSMPAETAGGVGAGRGPGARTPGWQQCPGNRGGNRQYHQARTPPTTAMVERWCSGAMAPRGTAADIQHPRRADGATAASRNVGQGLLCAGGRRAVNAAAGGRDRRLAARPLEIVIAYGRADGDMPLFPPPYCRRRKHNRSSPRRHHRRCLNGGTTSPSRPRSRHCSADTEQFWWKPLRSPGLKTSNQRHRRGGRDRPGLEWSSNLWQEASRCPSATQGTECRASSPFLERAPPPEPAGLLGHKRLNAGQGGAGEGRGGGGMEWNGMEGMEWSPVSGIEEWSGGK